MYINHFPDGRICPCYLLLLFLLSENIFQLLDRPTLLRIESPGGLAANFKSGEKILDLWTVGEFGDVVRDLGPLACLRGGGKIFLQLLKTLDCIIQSFDVLLRR